MKEQYTSVRNAPDQGVVHGRVLMHKLIAEIHNAPGESDGREDIRSFGNRSQASMMSARYARGSRGIENLFSALNVGGDVSVLHRIGHPQIDVDV